MMFYACFTMYHNILKVFHDVLLRLTMFSESCNDWHSLKDRHNAAEIGITQQGSAILSRK